mmetsp:Transcript_21234/g.27423  ORF Transcript_21234/g.27423 Transcript_21234/m.27423 type:complete len:212 (+) Transcript_21234:359-994(+)
MQHLANTLADIVLMLLNMWAHVADMVDFSKETNTTNELGEDIKRRWNNINQASCFLAFALHPLHAESARKILKLNEQEYRNWGENGNVLCTPRLAFAVRMNYMKDKLHLSPSTKDGYWVEERVDKELGKLGSSIKQWLMGKMTLSDSFNPATDDPGDWWSLQACEQPVLANFSMLLLSCPVQSASCKRVFKNYSAFHAKIGTTWDQGLLTK